MDWNNPLRSVAATVDSDVLKILVETEEAVTGAQLARLSGRSYAQVYAVVRRMVSGGLVRSHRYGRTDTYQLNREHVLASAFASIVASPARIEAELRLLAAAWDPQAETIAFLGPAARRQVKADGDIGLLLVRPEEVSKYDTAWRSQSDALHQRIRDLTGNGIQTLDLSRSELALAARSDMNPDELLRGGARVIFGRRLSVGRD